MSIVFEISRIRVDSPSIGFYWWRPRAGRDGRSTATSRRARARARPKRAHRAGNNISIERVARWVERALERAVGRRDARVTLG